MADVCHRDSFYPVLGFKARALGMSVLHQPSHIPSPVLLIVTCLMGSGVEFSTYEYSTARHGGVDLQFQDLECGTMKSSRLAWAI